MFDIYIGRGSEKKTVKSLSRLNDAILEAWTIHDKQREHVGVLHNGAVVFNTNFDDVEFCA